MENDIAYQCILNLIQNSFYSLNKYCNDPKRPMSTEEYFIRITPNFLDNTITIHDSGNGLTKTELKKTIEMIYSSSVQSTMEEKVQIQEKSKLNYNEADIEVTNKIFSPLFGVCDQITIQTKNDQSLTTTLEINEEYEIRDYNESFKRGTKFLLQIKEKFMNIYTEENLKSAIRKKCQLILNPYYLFYGKISNNNLIYEQININVSVWTKEQSMITEEEYENLYFSLTMDPKNYFGRKNLRVEGQLEFSTIFYIRHDNTKTQLSDIFNFNGNIFLYIRKKFIPHCCIKLPDYYNFVTGIIDSEDLPLNIRFENFQKSPIVRLITRNITKHIILQLLELSENNPDEYLKFYQKNSSKLKTALLNDVRNFRNIKQILQYYSSSNTEQMVSFPSYLERKKNTQNEIYYIIGQSIDQLRKDPLVENFRKMDIEVLFMTETIDVEVMQRMTDYGNVPFKNINDEENK
ncbi:heat shock protein [Anaeramoeba flamelloides]|uniref:Heat shock protein n=1 Tax=Anaeramoeba flamelloides TaxID=1746091 RepID=A0AAV7YE52_9EUKA|nr:heat shock protein [Anaeramoeba flamelloides]